MSWSESVDQALCFGWIDGVRHSIDSESYQIRFTPRRENSVWSTVNCKKVETLIAQELMLVTGLEIYQNRKRKNQGFMLLNKRKSNCLKHWNKNQEK